METSCSSLPKALWHSSIFNHLDVQDKLNLSLVNKFFRVLLEDYWEQICCNEIKRKQFFYGQWTPELKNKPTAISWKKHCADHYSRYGLATLLKSQKLTSSPRVIFSSSSPIEIAGKKLFGLDRNGWKNGRYYSIFKVWELHSFKLLCSWEEEDRLLDHKCTNERIVALTSGKLLVRDLDKQGVVIYEKACTNSTSTCKVDILGDRVLIFDSIQNLSVLNIRTNASVRIQGFFSENIVCSLTSKYVVSKNTDESALIKVWDPETGQLAKWYNSSILSKQNIIDSIEILQNSLVYNIINSTKLTLFDLDTQKVVEIDVGLGKEVNTWKVINQNVIFTHKNIANASWLDKYNCVDVHLLHADNNEVKFSFHWPENLFIDEWYFSNEKLLATFRSNKSITTFDIIQWEKSEESDKIH